MSAPESRPDPSTIATIAHPFVEMPGGLLPALHAVQHALGYLPADTARVLAESFNISRADVHGVITFYTHFRSSPPVGPVVQVCRAEACQARGANGLVHHAAAVGAGRVEVAEVFCLGNCALGPSIAIDGEVHAHVDPQRLTALIDQALIDQAGDAPRRRPTVGRSSPPSAGTVYVPSDTAARSVGADEVAAAFAAHGNVIRNGSRGMLWLEPLVEVVTDQGRVGYGPVGVDDVPGVLDAMRGDGHHPLLLGLVDELPWMRAQQRVTFARVGLIDPLSRHDYRANGGTAGLRAALAMTPAEVVQAVTRSGLRGRGGAAFPTGIKWATVADATGTAKYICANADEGDSGTFADRMLIEGDPYSLIEGMVIAGYAVGAHTGYVYVRSEYPDAVRTLRAAIAAATTEGWLGRNILNTGWSFELNVRVGAGAYICGEETSMLESLEGKRGEVRAKPPLPAHVGLFGCPTVINNVLTLATVPAILAGGAEAYAALGVGRSTGTQVFQLAGNIARGGIVETPFGITLEQLIHDLGGGTSSGRPATAVQVGGPLGAYLPPSSFGLSVDYETFAANDALVGHGGVVVFDDTVDMADQARFAMEFCAIESCGKCTPCRIGSTRGVEVIDRIVAGTDRDANLALLDELCDTMASTSLCAMGGLTPLPVRSALAHWPEHFQTAPQGAPR